MPRIAILYLLAAACSLGCKGNDSAPQATLVLATTTSTQDSGLLDELLPAFQRQTGIEVKVVAVGSGQAIELGRRGDADVLLTHSPAGEEQFVADGFARERLPVMHNDFVIVGPSADPANLKQTDSAAEALGVVAAGNHPFVSRGDDSGTHQRELALWKAAGIEPRGDWYLSAGAGMGQTLRIASEKKAYALTDRATWLALRSELGSAVLVEGNEELLNRYSVLVVRRNKSAAVQRAAEQFAQFLRSPEGRQIIGQFGQEKFGQPLFVPDNHES
jgi:tungstate transport system substrate-binding protein